MATKRTIDLDKLGENVRRARAIAHLAQVATDDGNDHTIQTGLAMCVVDDLLDEAEAIIQGAAAA